MKRLTKEATAATEGQRPAPATRWSPRVGVAFAGFQGTRIRVKRDYVTAGIFVLVLLLHQTCYGQWVFERLRSFGSADADGAVPLAELAEGTDGVLYGTTSSGGTSNLGTIFKIGKDGSGYAILH